MVDVVLAGQAQAAISETTTWFQCRTELLNCGLLSRCRETNTPTTVPHASDLNTVPGNQPSTETNSAASRGRRPRARAPPVTPTCTHTPTRAARKRSVRVRAQAAGRLGGPRPGSPGD